MAALRHSSHEHPLESVNLVNKSGRVQCYFFHKEVEDEDLPYACRECEFYFHGRCAEVPLQIERHPFHPIHALSLVHDRLMRCDACKEHFHRGGSSFSCDECCFDLDLQCALSILPPKADLGAERVADGLHDHELTPFFAEWRIDLRCVLCTGFISQDGYICLHPQCKFLIHERCARDQHYQDGMRFPRVYHEHSLVAFGGDDVGLVRAGCANCQLDISDEFMGCVWCESFVHRDCILVPEILNYPPHPDLALVLFINNADKHGLPCRSCSCPMQGELCYRCIQCEFHLHIGCGLRTIGYHEGGMTLEIELSWHEHPILLCHRAKPFFNSCTCCEDVFDCPAYVCGAEDCGLVLHKECTELEPTINHPHHPDHPLALLAEKREGLVRCAACRTTIQGFSYSCQLCKFYLHIRCASRFPNRKHYLHEHDLVRFYEISSMECNRCRTPDDDSPLFRCVPCNFNLHEKCMELPPVVKHETHFHPLILRDFFMEDNTGEYYCDLCEKRRDGRLGVYVCGECKMERPWAFHIECILPELKKVYVKEDNTAAIERLANEIAWREERVRETETKLDEMKQELDELRKKHATMMTLE